jgi:flagellar hook-basal body complex protein FliE
MNVTDIKDVSLFPSEKIINRQQGRNDPISDFKEFLTRSVNEVNELAAESNRSVEQMVLGKMDIHQHGRATAKTDPVRIGGKKPGIGIG